MVRFWGPCFLREIMQIVFKNVKQNIWQTCCSVIVYSSANFPENQYCIEGNCRHKIELSVCLSVFLLPVISTTIITIFSPLRANLRAHSSVGTPFESLSTVMVIQTATGLPVAFITSMAHSASSTAKKSCEVGQKIRW